MKVNIYVGVLINNEKWLCIKNGHIWTYVWAYVHINEPFHFMTHAWKHATLSNIWYQGLVVSRDFITYYVHQMKSGCTVAIATDNQKMTFCSRSGHTWSRLIQHAFFLINFHHSFWSLTGSCRLILTNITWLVFMCSRWAQPLRSAQGQTVSVTFDLSATFY